MDNKVCRVCSQDRPIEDFKFRNKVKGIRYSTCDSCRKSKSTQWSRSNPESRSAIQKRYCSSSKGRDRYFRTRYGIGLDEYNTLLAAQSGRCAICGEPPGKIALSVDHCHSTGKVRGLLCMQCNLAIGHCKDNPSIAIKMSDYLRKM